MISRLRCRKFFVSLFLFLCLIALDILLNPFREFFVEKKFPAESAPDSTPHAESSFSVPPSTPLHFLKSEFLTQLLAWDRNFRLRQLSREQTQKRLSPKLHDLVQAFSAISGAAHPLLEPYLLFASLFSESAVCRIPDPSIYVNDVGDISLTDSTTRETDSGIHIHANPFETSCSSLISYKETRIESIVSLRSRFQHVVCSLEALQKHFSDILDGLDRDSISLFYFLL